MHLLLRRAIPPALKRVAPYTKISLRGYRLPTRSTSMAEENIKYLVRVKGGPLEVAKAPKPTDLASNDVLIRLKAVAINPADTKMIDEGHRVTSYPFVPGLDGSGIIEATGDAVERIKVSDEMIGLFQSNDRSGSFQTFAIVDEQKVTKKPPSWAFEEAATLGVCYATAIAALGIGLKTPLPFIIDGPRTGLVPSYILVLGGSSALGAAVIQLLRLALPDSTVFATSSPKHHTHIVNTLGAHRAFDRSSSSLVEDVKRGTPASQGLDAIVDVVGAGTSDIFEAFNPNGPKRYAQVWTGEDKIQTPEDVDSVLFRSRDLSQLQGGDNIMLSLQTLLEDGRYKLPLPVNNVGQGFEALQKALDLMRMGVSGEKLVVTF
ncbi:chaperonin 10-like protein [Lophiotrema nucula]|uniref:Chaperonin 10-like protein n=1 Tax=Lophiotrema nucula TaxID=690887 RepID=A0A6A5ZY27_9PLEO|nr:chaperonin 10-like protein [Lophiotrema nucula]